MSTYMIQYINIFIIAPAILKRKDDEEMKKNDGLYPHIGEIVQGKAYRWDWRVKVLDVILTDYLFTPATISQEEITIYSRYYNQKPKPGEKEIFWPAENLIEKKISYQVLAIDNEGNVKLSRISIAKEKLELIEKNMEDTYLGIITDVFSFGANIDFEGIHGFCSIIETSFAKFLPPTKMFSIGEEYAFSIMQVKEDKTLLVSFKKTFPSLKKYFELYLSDTEILELQLLDRVNKDRDVKGKKSFFCFLEPVYSGIIELPEDLATYYGLSIEGKLRYLSPEGFKAEYLH